MICRRPNLFLIGSMKSATTYLSAMLGAHPQIFMSNPKEPCHFADPDTLRRTWPYMWEQGYWRSLDRYLALFAEAGDAPIVAEASTTYSKAPIFGGIPEKILKLSPDARFIYVMRDPVQRAISHYWHRVRWWGERRSMLSAITLDRQYRDTSNYIMQLEEYLAHAPRERFYLLTYEELVTNSAQELSRMYSWLGVDPSFRPSTMRTPEMVMPQEFVQMAASGPIARFARSRFYEKTGQRVLPVPVRSIASRVFLGVRTVRPEETPAQPAKNYLRAALRPHIENLGRLLNRAFPEWTTLYGTD
jgi:hypothetical protein